MPDETKPAREHLLELLSRLGLEQFGIKHYRAISAWLESTALQTTQGIVLAPAVDELRPIPGVWRSGLSRSHSVVARPEIRQHSGTAFIILGTAMAIWSGI